MKQKSLAVISFIFLLALSINAQDNKCSLKISQLKTAPEFQGFYMGMTVDEVKKLVPTIPTGKADDLGMMKTSFSPRFDPKIDKTKFENMRTVSFEFLDGKVMDLWIGYTSEFKWATLDDFLLQMGGMLGLPPATTWQTKGMERRLECEDFQVSVSMIAAGPSIHLTDKTMKKTWEQRRTLKAEQEDNNK